MIQAGDLIDNSIGVAFGLATLTSAAYGQIVSDVAGTLSNNFVEALAASLGLPRANLTDAQMATRRVRMWGTGGAVVGVAFGCLLGMSSLMFMDLEKSERLKKQRELRTLYSCLMEEGHNLIGAQHCSLFLLDSEPSGEDGHTYLTSMGWRGKEPTTAELNRTFKVYDKDDSGKITANELYHALRSVGWTAELADVEQMIDKFGSTSGELNFEQVHLQPQPASSSKLQHSPSCFLTLFRANACDQFCKLMRTALLVDEVRLKMRKGGSREKVIQSGEVMNVRDVETDPRIEDEVISDARRRQTPLLCKSCRRTIDILFRSLSFCLPCRAAAATRCEATTSNRYSSRPSSTTTAK